MACMAAAVMLCTWTVSHKPDGCGAHAACDMLTSVHYVMFMLTCSIFSSTTYQARLAATVSHTQCWQDGKHSLGMPSHSTGESPFAQWPMEAMWPA